MSRFHYSLKTHGLLFLGTAESVAGSDELFVQDRKSGHIFHKRVLRTPGYSQGNVPAPSYVPRQIRVPETPERALSTDRQFFEALAQSLGQNSILVTDDYSIVRVYGNISSFIEVSETTNLKMHLDLLKSPLREEARSLMTIALKNKAHRSGVRHLLAATDEEEVRLDVYPIVAKEINERAALIVFSPVKVDRKALSENDLKELDDGVAAERIRTLETEVASTREALQQTVEELETSNEELQSLNEELQSTNEELQASNEELETSNEELQSTNEELITVNEELQVTATELSERTGELTSVLESAPLAMIVVDSAFQIIQATRPAISLFGIKQPIASPHISQCVVPDGFPSLAPLCSEALQMGSTVHREFTSDGDRIKLSCSPYFEENGQIQGVTIVVSEFPRLSEEMELILRAGNVFYMHRNLKGEILRLSASSAAALNTEPEDAIGRNITEYLPQDIAQNLIEYDARYANGDMDATSQTVTFPSPGTGRNICLNVTRYGSSLEGPLGPSVYSVADDVTEIVGERDKAKNLAVNMQELQNFAGLGFWEVDLEDQSMYWSDEVHRIHRTDPQNFDLKMEDGISFYHPDDREEVRTLVEDVIENGGNFHFIKRLIAKDDTIVTVESHGIAVADGNGKVIKINGFFRELSASD